MIDVAEAIDAEAESVTLRAVAAAGGSYDSGGKWVANVAGTSTVQAAVQPARGNALMDLPKGIRTKAEWFAWSRAVIVVDDEITYRGISYRVIFAWPRAVDGFVRVALGRLK
jgi:hypothetical protein